MNKELGLTAEMFGFGVGIFFFGYFIGALQLDFGKGRRAAMDCQDHHLLGRDCRVIRFRAIDFRLYSKRRRPHRPAVASNTPLQCAPHVPHLPSAERFHTVMSYQSRPISVDPQA
jgi:hypothetical protein